MPALFHTRTLRGLALVLLAACWMLVAPGAASAAMTIDSGPHVRVSTFQVTIWWVSSSSGSSELRWDSQARTSFAAFPNDVSNTATTLGTVHSRTISNLLAGTYSYRIRTVGASGTATSQTHSFQVSPTNGATPIGKLAVDGTVEDTVLSGGKAYVGGQFDQIGERTGGGIFLDPANAALYPGIPQIDNAVATSISDGTGGMFVAGTFSHVGGVPRAGLAHLLPDGGLDPYFDAGTAAAGGIYDLAISGSRLYAGGLFTTFNGVSRNRIVALDTATGAVDLSWNPGTGASSIVETVLVSGTKLYVGGQFLSWNGTTRNRLAAVDLVTGALDLAWDPGAGADNTVYDLDTDGTRLYVGGTFLNLGGVARSKFGALTLATAALDGAFITGSGADNTVYAVVVSGGRLYLGGWFTFVAGNSRPKVAAVNSVTGAIDLGFNAGGTGFVYALGMSGGRLYVGGLFSTAGGSPRGNIAALNPTTGAVDAGFLSDPGTDTTVNSIGFDSNGRVYLGGPFYMYNGVPRKNLAKFDATTGDLDLTFAPGVGPNNNVRALAISGSRLYVGGMFITYAGSSAKYFAAVSTTTAALDVGFVTGGGVNGANNNVNTLLVSGTRLYLGGQFTNVSGSARLRVAAVDTTTAAVDLGFDTSAGADNTVNDMALSGTRLYVGGDLLNWGVTGRARIAAVDATSGVLDVGFVPGTGPSATVEALYAGASKLYVGGSFTNYNGTLRNRIAAVNLATGAIDLTFNPGTGAASPVYAITADPGGTRLYVGGTFWTFNGLTYRTLVAVDPATGAVDTGFSPGAGAGANSVFSIAVDSTRVAVGGNIAQWNGTSSEAFVLLPITSPTGFDNDLGALAITQQPQKVMAPYQATIYWTTSGTSSSELVWDGAPQTAWTDYEYNVSNTATALGTVHSRTISNLPQGTYYYRVRSRNAAGEQATSAEMSFTIDGPGAGTPLGNTVADGNVIQLAATPTLTYLAGTFTRVGTRIGSGVEIDQATAVRQGGTPQVNGGVQSSIPDGSGGTYIGGAFTSVGGLATGGVAHLLPDGGVDPNFVPGLGIHTAAGGNGYYVAGLALSGGKLYLGGSFATYQGVARANLVAIDPATAAIDNSFAPAPSGPNGSVNALEVAGAKLYVGGAFATYGGVGRSNIAAVSAATGALDLTFDPGTGANNSVYALKLAGGRLYLGGWFTSFNGTARSYLAAVDATTGAHDLGFVPPAYGGWVYAITSNGTSLYVGGQFAGRVDAIDLVTGANIAAFNPGTGGNNTVKELSVSGTKLYIGGNFTLYNGTARDRIVAVDLTTAAIDPTFDVGTGPGQTIETMSISAGKIYVGGQFSTWGAAARAGVAAIDSVDGTLDPTFNPGTGPDVNGAVQTIAVSGTRVYIGGSFITYNGIARARVAALDATTGAVDLGFNPGTGADSLVYTLAVSGGRLYLGGMFLNYNGVGRARIAAVDAATGALDVGFNPGTGADNTVSTLAVSGTRLYLGGSFLNYNAVGRARIAAVDTATAALDLGFNPGTGANNVVTEFATSATRLYMSGGFTTYNGTSRRSLASVDLATAALDLTFNPGTGPNASGVALGLYGSKLYIAGLTAYNGVPVSRGAMIDSATAALDPTFAHDPELQSGGASSVAVVGTRIFTAGTYMSYGYLAQGGVAMFDMCDRTTYCGDEILRDYLLVSAPASVALGVLTTDTSATATLPVTVQSNALMGYSLAATDTSDTAGMSCTVGGCAGQSIVDWTGTPATPSTWAEAGVNYGFGVTVLSSTLVAKNAARWGTGTLSTDFVNNKYAGLDNGASTLLHTIPKFLGTSADVTTLALRTRVGIAQSPGAYSGTVTITVTANP